MAVTYEDEPAPPSTNAAEQSQPLNRMRWATVRKPGRRGTNKRRSIFNRNAARLSGLGGKRDSGATDPTHLKGEEVANDKASEGQTHRTVYVNRTLPAEARDESGSPLQTFKRNKIRTAKYTPISFIPKNLWFQLHNIANVYFIFIVILGVSALPIFCLLYTSPSPRDS